MKMICTKNYIINLICHMEVAFCKPHWGGVESKKCHKFQQALHGTENLGVVFQVEFELSAHICLVVRQHNIANKLVSIGQLFPNAT